jgi:hypothetical protein
MRLVVFTAMFFTVSANAVEPNHDYKQILGIIKLDNACITDSEVRSIKPIKVCIKSKLPSAYNDYGDEIQAEENCKNYEMQMIAYPREFKETYCATNSAFSDEYGYCTKIEKKVDFLPEKIKISNYTYNGDEAIPVFTTYSLPRCN